MWVVIAMFQSARCGSKGQQSACWSEGSQCALLVVGIHSVRCYSDDSKCTLWL